LLFLFWPPLKRDSKRAPSVRREAPKAWEKAPVGLSFARGESLRAGCARYAVCHTTELSTTTVSVSEQFHKMVF